MSIFSKIILLLFLFLLLNIVSIFTFDYDEYFRTKGIQNDFKKSINLIKENKKYKPSNFTITKIDDILELNGTFENYNMAQNVTQALEINKEGIIKYEKNVSVDKNVLEAIFPLIVPFKDFFSNNSQIKVSNGEIILSGELKNKMYQDLIDTILSQTKGNVNIKTQITVPQEVVEEPKQEEESTPPSLTKEDIQLQINNILAQQKISFERRSLTPTAASQNSIQQIAKILNENPNFKVEVAGYTDSRGDDTLNKQISQNRATSVKNILISLGVDESRIEAIGYGEESPIAKDDENGLSEINRRVEFIIKE